MTRPGSIVRPTLRAVALLSLAGTALGAQMQPTGPFVGILGEGFEEQHVSAGGEHVSIQSCLAGGLFQGVGELCTPIGLGVYLDSQLTMPDGCVLAPHAGSYACTSLGQFLELHCDPPLHRFGGRFATFTPTDNLVTVWFESASGQVIGVDSFDLTSDCTWAWHGWEFQQPVATVRVVGDGDWFGLTGLVALDDLQADPDLSGSPGIGTVQCSSTPGSTGQVPTLSVHGSDQASAGTLLLLAQGLPSGTFAVACAGRVQGIVVQPGGGQGVLCVGLPFGRVDPPAQAALDGSLLVPLDTTQMPSASPAGVLPGETWTFQVWYRDVNPLPTSNFTESVTVVFG